jgi:hypothetical protein
MLVLPRCPHFEPAQIEAGLAGDQAAKQDALVHSLGNKGILRTKDVYTGPVTQPEIEELLRDTLIKVAQADLGWDIAPTASAQASRPIVNVFAELIPDFSKYKLAKAYLRWTRSHTAADLAPQERTQWESLFTLINKALK